MCGQVSICVTELKSLTPQLFLSVCIYNACEHYIVGNELVVNSSFNICEHASKFMLAWILVF